MRWWLIIGWLSAISLECAAEKPYIVIIVADWGMQEKLHNAIEPQLPAAYVLALHIFGRKTVATGQRTLLVQVPTLQDFSQGQSFYSGCTKEVCARTKGIWVESNDGESACPDSPIAPYLVLSQPPLHPHPPSSTEKRVVGDFWVPPFLPLIERQKIYAMALDCAKKAGGCVLSVTFATQESWDNFQKWMVSIKDTVRWGTLDDHSRFVKGRVKNAVKQVS